MPCPLNHNPADFFIHALASIPGQEEETNKKVKEICDKFESEMGKDLLQMAKDNQPAVASANGGDSVTGPSNLQFKRSPYKASWSTQFSTVLWRSWTTVLREPRVLRMKAVQTIVGFFLSCHSPFDTILLNSHYYYYSVCRSLTCTDLQRPNNN